MINNYDKCPLCGGYTIRIRRRFIDRVISVFMPVTRYQCQNYHCQWQASIRKQHLNKSSNRHTSTHT